MRELIFGKMPAGASPETHIPAGLWCFAGQEEAFPGWDEGPFADLLPPDPYACAEEMSAAMRAANGEAVRLIKILGEEGNRINEISYSERFWELALGPFVILAAHAFFERQKRVLDLIKRHGEEDLRVEILPKDCPLRFGTNLDFMVKGVLDGDFNHYVFSRILEAAAPKNWRLVPAEPRPLGGVSKAAPGLAEKLKEVARNILRDLPFPRQKGFGLKDALSLSLAVRRNKDGKSKAFSFAAYGEEGGEFLFPAEKLFRACLPDAARKVSALPRLSGSPLRGMLPSFTQDDAYRLSLAAWEEAGGRLFDVQHGANYGQLRCTGGIPLEYCRHAFFSWGEPAHENTPGNFVPLPHPALAATANTHKEQEPTLVLVGTEMSSYLYRLKSRPLAGALPEYRREKVRFFTALAEHMAANTAGKAEQDGFIARHCLYRPYFKVVGGLDDAEYVLPRVPGLARCAGDLTARMLGCRLLVLDHYGTTLHMALAANVPTVAYWSGGWGMEKGVEEVLNALREADILHPNAASAAAHCARIWANVAEWRQSEKVQAARRLWLSKYAVCLDEAGRPLDRAYVLSLWRDALENC